jgi:hypothetical protein
MVPRAAIAAGDFAEIARLCTETRARLPEHRRTKQGMI